MKYYHTIDGVRRETDQQCVLDDLKVLTGVDFKKSYLASFKLSLKIGDTPEYVAEAVDE